MSCEAAEKAEGMVLRMGVAERIVHFLIIVTGRLLTTRCPYTGRRHQNSRFGRKVTILGNKIMMIQRRIIIGK